MYRMSDSICDCIYFLLEIIYGSVTMQAQKEAPLDMQCKDKFLLQSVVASSGTYAKDITPEMVLIWAKIQSLMRVFLSLIRKMYRLTKWVYILLLFSSIRSQGILSRSANWGLFMLIHLDRHPRFEKGQRKVLHQGLRYLIMGIWMLLNLHWWVFDRSVYEFK